jgi:hypothetical protein
MDARLVCGHIPSRDRPQSGQEHLTDLESELGRSAARGSISRRKGASPVHVVAAAHAALLATATLFIVIQAIEGSLP